jgi:hypothetical protein
MSLVHFAHCWLFKSQPIQQMGHFGRSWLSGISWYFLDLAHKPIHRSTTFSTPSVTKLCVKKRARSARWAVYFGAVCTGVRPTSLVPDPTETDDVEEEEAGTPCQLDNGWSEKCRAEWLSLMLAVLDMRTGAPTTVCLLSSTHCDSGYLVHSVLKSIVRRGREVCGEEVQICRTLCRSNSLPLSGKIATRGRPYRLPSWMHTRDR